MRMRTVVCVMVCAAVGTVGAVAQEVSSPRSEQQGETAPERRGPQFRLGAEVKLDLRHSSSQEFRLAFQAPPSFFEPGDEALYLRTPAAGTS